MSKIKLSEADVDVRRRIAERANPPTVIIDGE